MKGMGVSPRAVFVVVCAYFVGGLLAQLLWAVIRQEAHFGSYFPFFAGSNLLLGVAAIGVYWRQRWVRWLMLAHTLLWTALVGLYTAFTLEGLGGLVHWLLWQPKPDSVASYFAWRNFNAIWLRAILLWGLVWLAFRPARGAAPLPAVVQLENRAIAAGLCLVLAYYVFNPTILNLIQPVREIAPGLWSTDAEHARLVVSPERRRTAPAAAVRVIDDINEDIARLLAGQSPLHSTAPKIQGDINWYSAMSGKYSLTFFRRNGRIRSINVIIYDDKIREVAGIKIQFSMALR